MDAQPITDSVNPSSTSVASTGSKYLSKESLDSLNGLSPEIIVNQASINIGTLGHVGHGKSTIVENISGIKPQKHTKELERNITIKLGYANFKVFKCPSCPAPQCYQAASSKSLLHACDVCGKDTSLLRHFSFVDCPGHDCLMATMLNGAAVMDAALLIIAGNQKVPQAQTAEHLAAAEIMKLKNVIVCQTKLDLVDEQQAYENFSQIGEFLEGTLAANCPVVPLSCTPKKQCNVDVLLQYLCELVPVPSRDFKSSPQMQIVRSFDVNRPGDDFRSLKGGVAGGTLSRGLLRVGQPIEIRPGLIVKGDDGTVRCYPFFTKVVSLLSEQNTMQFAAPGGLIAVGTTLDPILCKNDRLVGQVIGEPGTLPDVFQEIEIQVFLMKRLIGVKDAEKPEKIHKLKKNENLMINIASNSSLGKVVAVKDSMAKILLANPCCVALGERVSLSRNVNDSFRLIGCGKILHGVSLKLEKGVPLSE